MESTPSPPYSLTLSQTDKNFFLAFLMAKRLIERVWNFLTFPIYMLTKDFRKKIWHFLRGYPHFGPPKLVSDQKWPTMTPYDHPILMQNHFLHKKWGCLQKTRALYFEKWPSYGHVKFGKRNLKISEKLAWPTKILITPSIFEISSKFFFLRITYGPL